MFIVAAKSFNAICQFQDTTKNRVEDVDFIIHQEGRAINCRKTCKWHWKHI